MADPFAYDAQNPWFSKQQVAGGPVNPAPPLNNPDGPGVTGAGATDASGWDWSKGFHSANPAGDLNTVLDSSKWQSWTPDNWRLATGGYGNNESSFLGSLQKNMGNDDLYHNYMNTYGVGGSRYVPGGYDWKTNTFNRDPTVTADVLNTANTAPMFGGANNVNANLSNPDPKHAGYSRTAYGVDSAQVYMNQQRMLAEQKARADALAKQQAIRAGTVAKNPVKVPGKGTVKAPFGWPSREAYDQAVESAKRLGTNVTPPGTAPTMPTVTTPAVRPNVTNTNPVVTSVKNVNRLRRP